VIVSNQSGVGRGLLTDDDVASVNSRVAFLLEAEGVAISSWHYCPHHPDARCTCRKPATGMFDAADQLYPVDWERSIMVGDKPSDVYAGLSLGMTSVLVTTGYGHLHERWAQENSITIVQSLADLATKLL
jgi:histidinol-phosphate phosphatase family protein